MKNFNEHTFLAVRLRNYGYNAVAIYNGAGEPMLLVESSAIAEELFEIFGADGFAFGTKWRTNS